MLNGIGRTLGQIARAAKKNPIPTSLILICLMVIVGRQALDYLNSSEGSDIGQKLYEISEYLHPTYDEVSSEKFFSGSSIVSDNLSYARPTRPPCNRNSTTVFLEAMRKRECSVVFEMQGGFFLFWGWEQPRKTTVGTSVEGAVQEIQERVGKNYIVTDTLNVSTSNFLARLNSNVPITEDATSTSGSPHAETQAAIQANPPTNVLVADFKDLEFFPRDSDRQNLPSLDHIVILPASKKIASDGLKMQFMIGEQGYECEGGHLKDNEFSCDTPFSGGTSFHVHGKVLAKPDNNQYGQQDVLSLTFARDDGVQMLVYPKVLLKCWEGD